MSRIPTGLFCAFSVPWHNKSWSRSGEKYVAVMFLTCSGRILAVASLLLLVTVVAHPQKRRLTQSEAVALAEQFIAQNGYTDLPPDKTKISYETIEWESNVDRILQQRHNTLERRAYGVSRGRRGERGWTVVFRYQGHAGATGRAVTMNLDGAKARVEHQDFILRYAKKL